MPKNQTAAADLDKLATLAATHPRRPRTIRSAPRKPAKARAAPPATYAPEPLPPAAVATLWARTAQLDVDTKRVHYLGLLDQINAQIERYEAQRADVLEALAFYCGSATPAKVATPQQLRIVADHVADAGGEAA